MGKAERTRQYIIEKAAPVFNVKGMAGSSIQDIMKATSLAKGGIYGNFSDKEELTTAVFDYIADLLKAKLKEASAAASTPGGKLLAILDFYENYPADPPMTGGCPILSFGVEADDTHPELTKKVAELILYLQEGIAKLVRKGIDSGEFRSDWDAERFAVKMFALIEGAMVASQALKNPKQMKVVVEMLKQEVQFNML